MGRLTELIRRELGIVTETVVNERVTTLGTAAAVALQNDPDRVAAVVVNLSVNAVYLGPFEDVASSKGIRLSPSGGSMTLIWSEDLELTGDEWYGIADAAASAVLTVEIRAR